MLFLNWVWFEDRKRNADVIDQVNQITKVLDSLDSNISESVKDTTRDEGGSFVCDSDCQKLVSREIQIALLDWSLNRSNASDSGTLIDTNVQTVAGTFYIPLSGTGSSKSLDWVNIPTTETRIDWAEYSGEKTITWDAYARVFQGNGKVFIRLFDVTNGVAVPGSEMETGSETTVHLISGSLSVNSGNNTYLVQVRTLTGYEGFFESGRIKVNVK